MTGPAADSATALAHQLQATVTDLDGYIQRRAAALAEPHIAKARAEAAADAGRLRAELTWRDDLVAELRRRITGLEDRLDDLRAKYGERRDPDVAARRHPVALPPDHRPPPDVAKYDQLLPRRRAAAPAPEGPVPR